MKKLLHILLICFFYVILTGRSCEDDSDRISWQEEQAMIARDSIILMIDTKFLSEEDCRAEEAEAIQHLADLGDYMAIFTDQEMDSTFRVKAGEMIRKMFVPEDVTLSFGQMKNKKMKTNSLDEFLRTGFGDEINKAKVIFDSIRVIKPIEKAGDEIYSGKLAANQIIIEYHEFDSIKYPSLPITVEFISSRENKIIGQDTLKVWELKLGDMH